MVVGRMMTVGLVLAFVGCTASTESAVGKPAAVMPGPMVTGCPLGVSGALATIESDEQGVALTFLTAPERVDELRARTRHAAEFHGPDAHLGLGHAGTHGQGGQHGLHAMQLPPTRATVTDVKAGARVELVPVDPADRGALEAKAQDGVRRMNESCTRSRPRSKWTRVPLVIDSRHFKDLSRPHAP